MQVYWPFLLITKKRYAGLLWTKPDKWDKMDAKGQIKSDQNAQFGNWIPDLGIETVRRDNCPLVRNVVTTCLHKILIDVRLYFISSCLSFHFFSLPTQAWCWRRQVLCKAHDWRLASEQTRSLVARDHQSSKSKDRGLCSETSSRWTCGQVCWFLLYLIWVDLFSSRMRKRNPGSAPAMGDRVPYVIIKAAKSNFFSFLWFQPKVDFINADARAYEKAEDPLWVLENNIPLDTQCDF